MGFVGWARFGEPLVGGFVQVEGEGTVTGWTGGEGRGKAGRSAAKGGSVDVDGGGRELGTGSVAVGATFDVAGIEPWVVDHEAEIPEDDLLADADQDLRTVGILPGAEGERCNAASVRLQSGNKLTFLGAVDFDRSLFVADGE